MKKWLLGLGGLVVVGSALAQAPPGSTPVWVQGGVPVATFPSPTTYQGILNLSATTSTQLIAANVTMTFGALPDPGAFAKLTIIAPGSSCSFTVNWGGGTATATSGEQFGAGTNVGSDTKNLTGLANAPTLYSTAGCAPPNLIQFSN